MNFEFNYIEENIEKINQNPDSVFIIKPGFVGKKKALFALIKEDAGVYKNIQLTKEQSDWIFPAVPIKYFHNGPGYYLLNNYIIFDNYEAVNITNLEGFKIAPYKGKIFNTGLYATFNDGSATFLIRDTAKSFEKNGGLEPYIKLLEQYKEYNPQYETYEVIEKHYIGDKTYIIPKLQEKNKEEVKTKKLVKE